MVCPCTVPDEKSAKLFCQTWGCIWEDNVHLALWGGTPPPRLKRLASLQFLLGSRVEGSSLPSR